MAGQVFQGEGEDAFLNLDTKTGDVYAHGAGSWSMRRVAAGIK